jgi:ketosteroid isomerase-like protein
MRMDVDRAFRKEDRMVEELPVATRDDIRELIERRAAAIRARDVEAVLAPAGEHIVLYDALGSLERRGKDDLRQKTAEWLGWYEGGLGFEIRDLTVYANDDIGFCYYLYHVTGELTNGSAVDMWVRATVGLAKRDGVWQIVHEHTSVPFDAGSGQAIVDAQPL